MEVTEALEISFRHAPQSSSFAIATRYRRDAPDGPRRPSQATGTAGRLSEAAMSLRSATTSGVAIPALRCV